MRKTIKLTLILLMFAQISVYSQDLDKFVNAGKNDMQFLFKGYMSPLADGFGKSLNAGWYTTAEVHAILGFDITASISVAKAPGSAKYFTINEGDLENFNLPDGKTSVQAPTFFADKNEGPTLTPKVAGDLASLTTPAGMGMAYAMGVAPQIGIGLPFGFELRAKYFPEIKLGDAGKVGLWGVALRHNLLQYLPLGDNVPFVNVSVMAAYSKLNSAISFEQGSSLGDQSFESGISAFTTNLCASVDIPFLTAYLSVGYGYTKSNFSLDGKFSVPVLINPNDPQQGFETKEIDNPLDFNVTTSDLRATVGVKVKLLLFHIFADYTIDGEYKVSSIGCAISLR